MDARRSSDATNPADAATANTTTGPASGDAGAESSADAAVSTAPCNGTVDCERVVFVTSQTFKGFQVQGLIGADAACNALAAMSTDARVAGRFYVAWISDWSDSASSRMVHGTKPYVRPDGKRIAASYAALTSGSALDEAIAIDERGVLQQGSVWTGTTPAGSQNGPTCEGWWTKEANGAQGDITSAAGTWTARSGAASSAPCEETAARLYCFEQ